MGRKLLIGVIITDCQIDFQSEILRGIISQAFRTKCNIVALSPLHNFSLRSVHKDTEKAVLELIRSDRFDGFIYDRNSFVDDDIREYIDELCKQTGKPVMLLDSQDHKNFETIAADDCSAFEAVTDHLIEVHNRKRIYCITGPKGYFSSEERLKGYFNSMKSHGLRYDRTFYEYGDFWTEKSAAFAEKIISGKLPRPDGIVCGNDIMAVSICHALINAGIRVPEDISVTGYDASLEGSQAEPSVTSYRRPNFQLGAEAFRRLYRIITGKICTRVHNESGGLRLGTSCGCHGLPRLTGKAKRHEVISARFENDMKYGDMLFDITNAASPEAFADRLDNYTYFIYRLSHFKICLTDSFMRLSAGDSSVKLDFHSGDAVHELLSKTIIMRDYRCRTNITSDDFISSLAERNELPSAYYVSPLHYNDHFFGLAAVSFGKFPMAYNSSYRQWINYVNVALEQVLMRSSLRNALKDSSRLTMYDSTTGKLNSIGLKKEFTRLADSGRMPSECICIDFSGIRKIYYQYGEERSLSVRKDFTEIVSDCIRPGEVYGFYSLATIVILTSLPERSGEIFSGICNSLKESRFGSGSEINLDFSVGTAQITADEEADLSAYVHKALVNKVHSYAVSENNTNPQFEKLCVLRSRIMKNPEQQWKISEIADKLYLSKSYLQKIYKSYFNKSIIEEMIEFRIEKAQELLIETDRTITDISRECGYSSYNYFVRQFREIAGCSPSEYRDKLKK
ncbi:MAG: substrate-binding domain-containing protein [Ruminococcus sp.]|nr:substrate-binding domain-containing protein [Ruminococcus sp.]